MVIPSVQPNQQRCATCQYWKGERRIKTLNSREKVVEPLSFDGEWPNAHLPHQAEFQPGAHEQRRMHI